MHGTNYKVESEVRQHGEVMNLPAAANTLSIEPAGAGYVRITYLKPVHEIAFESPADAEDALASVD